MRKITKITMTVKDAMDYLYYEDSIHYEYDGEEYEPIYNDVCSLVDDYNFLVALITERCGGATGKVDFNVLRNYTSDEINQMIDNLVEEELIA